MPRSRAAVDTQAIGTQLGHAQRDLVVEMDVSHQRDGGLLLDAPESLGCLHGRHRYAHDIGAGVLEIPDLGDGRVHVRRFGVGHALHADRRVAADGDPSYHDAAASTPLDVILAEHQLFTAVSSPSVKRATWPRL